ncbi:MAG: DUF4241 domain-containing protein [Pseudomonadota bacterium]
MAYPNVAWWSALRGGASASVGEDVFNLSTVDCGTLSLPSGKLFACDPFVVMERGGNFAVNAPPGEHKVIVTLADVSKPGEPEHIREAYATILFNPAAAETTRRIITPSAEGPTPPEMDAEGGYIGFGVDTGTACFGDDVTIARGMPDPQAVDWFEEIFETGAPGSWFDRLDDPDHIRDGLANIALPEGRDGDNILIFHSGWGDGVYPLIGGYDAEGRLIRAHIDFFVITNFDH